MKKKHIVIVMITVIVIELLFYFIGYKTCDRRYKNYYDATENLLDSINANDMLDVIMESDEYQDYLNAKKNL